MATTCEVDWSSPASDVLLNPRMPGCEQQRLREIMGKVVGLEGHLWLATSGSSGQMKWVALSKQAILASAHGVNCHLEAVAEDIWLNPLPNFHVGGLGIWARSFLCGSQVVPYIGQGGKWCVHHFLAQLIASHATLTAVVPAQIFDLVAHNIQSPKSLRAVVVGGGALSEEVYKAAVALGWKLLPSYGLTECASQVATAALGSWNDKQFPSLVVLPHVQVELSDQGYLKIQSKALLSGYLSIEQDSFSFVDPKLLGWFVTEDRGVFDNEGLKQISRGEHFIKIGGESVDMRRLETILEEVRLSLCFKSDIAVFPLPDPRLGHVVHLAIAAENERCAHDIVKQFDTRVLPFERIRQVHCVPEIPRSPLKKVLRTELIQLC